MPDNSQTEVELIITQYQQELATVQSTLFAAKAKIHVLTLERNDLRSKVQDQDTTKEQEAPVAGQCIEDIVHTSRTQEKRTS